MSGSAWNRWGGAETASHLARSSKDRQELSRQGKTGRKSKAERGSWAGVGEEGYVIIHVCSREPSTGCLEELNTVSTPEPGGQEAMTKSTKMCKKKKPKESMST